MVRVTLNRQKYQKTLTKRKEESKRGKKRVKMEIKKESNQANKQTHRCTVKIGKDKIHLFKKKNVLKKEK